MRSDSIHSAMSSAVVGTVSKYIVRSSQVLPLMSDTPAISNGPKYSPLWFSEPLNIRCSNRCAKPVRPVGSSFEPTWYQMATDTTGALRSVCTITRRPLDKVNDSYGMSSSALGDAACAMEGANAVPPMAKDSASDNAH